VDSRERFLAFFWGDAPDRIPFYEQAVASGVASALLGRTAHTGSMRLLRDCAEAGLRGPEAYEEFIATVLDDWTALADLLSFDGIGVPWLGGGATQKVGEHEYLFGDPEGDWYVNRFDPVAETWGTVRKSGREPTLDELEQRGREQARQIANAPPATEEDFPHLRMLIERNRGRRAIVAGLGLGIPLDRVWLEAVILRPSLIERHLDNAVEIARRAAPVLARMGVDVIFGGGDLADKNGCVYGPKVFHEVVLPRATAIVEAVHSQGLPYVFRTDGNIWSIAEDLFVASGADGYGEIDQDAGMEFGAIRERFPSLTLWGGVPCGTILARGTPEQVRAAALDSIEKAKSGGGIILGSSNTIIAGTPPENVWAMAEVARGTSPL
jgi:hypothetical protein